MMRSLYSAVSGLKTHQTRMDVIGNNISNVNTEAFKSSSVTFSEIMYQTTSSASAGNGALGVGGVNAKQIGLGVATGATQMSITTAGAAETTGNPFDLKLTDSQTTNFFVVSDGTNNMFTRAGSFYVDGNGYLCMTSTGYTLMGWQVEEESGQIRKDTVTPLQVMSPANQTSSPEATEKAYISGVLDKNDSNLTSVDGYAQSMLFYDDLGYAYTAKFAVKPADTANGQYTISLADIIDQNSKSIFAPGARYENSNIRDLFGNTATTEINIPLPKTNAGLKVGEAYWDATNGVYKVITEKVAASKYGFTFPAGKTNPDYVTTVDNGNGTTTGYKTYQMFGLTDTDFGQANGTNTTVGQYRKIGNLSTDTMTVQKNVAIPAGFTWNGGVLTRTADGETFTYDAQSNAFRSTTGASMTTAALFGLTEADGTVIEDGVYKTQNYTFDTTNGILLMTEERKLPGKEDETNLNDKQFYYDSKTGMYYYIQSATVKGEQPAEIKELDTNGNGYLSYTDENGTTQTLSVAKAFGFTSGKDTTVSVVDGVATGSIQTTDFTMTFNVKDGTFNSIVTDGQTTANLNMALLGENFKNVVIDFKQMLNYNNGGTSTVKMLRGDITGDGAGKKLGALTGITVDSSGKIYGSYDNGNTVLLCQIAVAQFSNASGLEKIGNSCYQTTLNSGEFDGIGIEVNADGSSINTGELEMSNVDLSGEFTSMIVTQRGFQANSRVITTSDTLLEELINLKR